MQRIIEPLPVYADDYAHLRIGDAGIKQKRWYIEGFERFSRNGKVIDCAPKGIEIRTTIHSSIQGVIAELLESFDRLRQEATRLLNSVYRGWSMLPIWLQIAERELIQCYGWGWFDYRVDDSS